ncbi:MAG: hypothetical protein AAF735_07910 [Myxococcota bacterium]
MSPFSLVTLTALHLFGAAPQAVGVVRVEGEHLFTMKQHERGGANGSVTLERRYIDRQGANVYQETATILEGVQRSQRSSDRQAKEEGRLRINGRVVEYWLKKADGSIETKRDDVDPPMVASTGLVPFIVRDDVWSRLLAGEQVRFSYLSWSQQENYRFLLVADPRSLRRVNGETFTVIMKPSSWIVRRLFDAIRYDFVRSERRLIRYRGRISVRKPVEGRYEDINEADVRFSR